VPSLLRINPSLPSDARFVSANHGKSAPSPPARTSAITLGNTDGEIGGLTIPPDGRDPPAQAEVQALRDTCEELADDVQALSATVHVLWETLACHPKPLREAASPPTLSELRRASSASPAKRDRRRMAAVRVVRGGA